MERKANSTSRGGYFFQTQSKISIAFKTRLTSPEAGYFCQEDAENAPTRHNSSNCKCHTQTSRQDRNHISKMADTMS